MIMTKKIQNILTTTISTYKRNRKIQLRAYPISFMFQRILGALLSLLMPVILYYYVFDKNMSNSYFSKVSNMNYLLYVGLGYCSYSISIATLMNVGRAFILEIREETINSFLLSPASRIGYFIGVYLEQLGRSFVEFFVIFIFGILIGMPFNIKELLFVIIAVAILSLVSFSMAILLSTIMVFTRDTFITQNTLFILLTILSGISFPITYFPRIISSLCNLIPLTYAITIFRNLVYKQILFWDNFFIMFIESLLYLMIGYWGFRKLEKRLIEEVLS